MNDVLLALVLAGSLLGCLVLARHRYRSRLAEWRELIEPAGVRLAENVSESCVLDQLMADHAFGAATRARAELNPLEAIRLLELMLRVVEESTPSRVRRLKAMSRRIRMSMAILPLEPVRSSQFSLTRVSLVARLGALLDCLAVAPAERMAIRLRVLRLEFHLTVRMLRANIKALSRRPGCEASWRRVHLALKDWGAVDEEHLRSLRALLSTIAVDLKRQELAPQH
jgi:hypothetical protein